MCTYFRFDNLFHIEPVRLTEEFQVSNKKLSIHVLYDFGKIFNCLDFRAANDTEFDASFAESVDQLCSAESGSGCEDPAHGRKVGDVV